MEVKIDFYKLAYHLAELDFARKHEEDKFQDIFERVDETGRWYVKKNYQDEFDNLVQWYEDIIDDFII